VRRALGREQTADERHAGSEPGWLEKGYGVKTYRAAVVGLTGIASSPPKPAADAVLEHEAPGSHVSAYAYHPQTTVAAVCDLVPDLLQRFHDTWGETFPQANTYTDYREMLRAEQPDLVSVVTSDHRHAQMVVDAVEAGVKGIFCEKPIATTLADADRMIAACSAHNVPLVIDHTMRWWPDYVEARRLLRDGAIGEVRRVMVTGCGPRAMLFRNTTHVVDMLCYLVDADPDWLMAELDDQWRDYPPRYAGDGGHDPATDPGVSAYVHFKNGVRAHINCAQLPVAYREWDVIGEKGRLRIGYNAAELWRLQPDEQLAMTPLRARYVTRAGIYAAVSELVQLVERGGRGSSTGEDGRRTLSILLGMLQSAADGSARVRFPVGDR
jgi:predicted dehydrogenase